MSYMYRIIALNLVCGLAMALVSYLCSILSRTSTSHYYLDKLSKIDIILTLFTAMLLGLLLLSYIREEKELDLL